MQTVTFIKTANSLIKEIRNFSATDDHAVQDKIQKKINDLFSNLQNPSLMCAMDLKNAALKSGFNVDPRIVNQLDKFEKLVAA